MPRSPIYAVYRKCKQGGKATEEIMTSGNELKVLASHCKWHSASSRELQIIIIFNMLLLFIETKPPKCLPIFTHTGHRKQFFLILIKLTDSQSGSYLKTMRAGLRVCWRPHLQSMTKHWWYFHWSSIKFCTPSRPAANQWDQNPLNNPLTWVNKSQIEKLLGQDLFNFYIFNMMLNFPWYFICIIYNSVLLKLISYLQI